MRHASEREELGKRGKDSCRPRWLICFLGFCRRTTVPAGSAPSTASIKRLAAWWCWHAPGPLKPIWACSFAQHTIDREYVALVRGRAKAGRIESLLVRDRGDGRRGTGNSEEGQRAVTNIRVLEKLGAFTLVACRLETGRTHQVRIHLGEAGTPLCGERVYDRPLNGKPAADASGAQRPLLHATYLSFDHPETGQRVSWRAKLPRDMDEMLRKLRYKTKARERHEQRDSGA